MKKHGRKTMASWNYLIRFVADDGQIYFGQLDQPALPEGSVTGFTSLEALENGKDGNTVRLQKVTCFPHRLMLSASSKEKVNSSSRLRQRRTTRSSALEPIIASMPKRPKCVVPL
jgi:hypothetical protein